VKRTEIKKKTDRSRALSKVFPHSFFFTRTTKKCCPGSGSVIRYDSV
jgi:hypothetical protein